MNRITIGQLLVGGLALALAACTAAPAPSSSTSAAPSVAVAPTPAPLPPMRIVVIGDSTVCIWPVNDPLHRAGWGMFVQPYFTEEVTVVNLAASGRSTKTFITEGRWARALAEKPNLVLIQFGHNDSHAPGRTESTDSATDFRDYLRRYIDEARAAGATPVLVTPMCRRTPTDNLRPYAEAMIAVGKEKTVPVIDLHAASAKLYAELGPEGVHTLEAVLASGQWDPTHFNPAGAQAMAKLVVPELFVVEPQLKLYAKPAPPAAP